jgi:iron complex outermembrane receptor protein
MNNLAFYIQDEVSLVDDKLNILAGLRYDMVKFYDGQYITTDGAWSPILPDLKDHKWNALSPRVSAGYKFNHNLKAYISYAFGFRASILDDLCRSGWMWVGPKIANPELGPEKLNNYEAGLNIRAGEKLRILPTIYYSKGKDFLYYIQTEDSLWGKRPVFQRENITSVSAYGLELEVEYKISAKLNLFSNYTYSHSEIDEFEKNPELAGKTLTFVPLHQAKAGLFWQNRWVNTSINMVYKSRQFADDNNTTVIDPYATVDLSFSKEFMNLLNVALSIQNLFDNRHMENAYYMSPGRVIMIKTGINF